jgi:Uma2 family endonuclease
MAIQPRLDERAALLLTMPDDTEDAPWMVMGDWQWHAVDVFMSVLNLHVQRRQLPWYTASYMKITMRRPDGRPLDLAPDAFVADAERRMRDSFDMAVERQPPRFVLEVVSKYSLTRDTKDKVAAYDALGVAEYAIFDSRERVRGPRLSGYRRDAGDAFVPWPPDAEGRLESRELGGLRLYVEDEHWLRLLDRDGDRLPSAEEEAQARTEEVARLREELRRLREGRE